MKINLFLFEFNFFLLSIALPFPKFDIFDSGTKTNQNQFDYFIFGLTFFSNPCFYPSMEINIVSSIILNHITQFCGIFLTLAPEEEIIVVEFDQSGENLYFNFLIPENHSNQIDSDPIQFYCEVLSSIFTFLGLLEGVVQAGYIESECDLDKDIKSYFNRNLLEELHCLNNFEMKFGCNLTLEKESLNQAIKIIIN
jgi:hypothetical protein